MCLFAAATASTSTLDRLKQIPLEFWWKLGLGVAILVAVVLLLRKLAKVNKLYLALGLAFVSAMIGFNWVYERNEPAWATPVVQVLAEFFPSKPRN